MYSDGSLASPADYASDTLHDAAITFGGSSVSVGYFTYSKSYISRSLWWKALASLSPTTIPAFVQQHASHSLATLTEPVDYQNCCQWIKTAFRSHRCRLRLRLTLVQYAATPHTDPATGFASTVWATNNTSSIVHGNYKERSDAQVCEFTFDVVSGSCYT